MSSQKIKLSDLTKILNTELDPSFLGEEIDKDTFEMLHRVAQQNRMIQAMIMIFGWLNGAIVGFVVIAWIGDFWRTTPIIDNHVVMSLVGATVVQAGLAFMAITKYLFPGSERKPR